MRVQFYKPNAKVTGSACSFWLTDDGSIMSSLIKQDSWDNARKRGSFSKNKDNPNKKVIIKLGASEAGAIVDAIENNRKWSSYHQSKNQITKINFGPYERNGEQVGYSYSINKEDKEDSTNKVGFVIGFTFGEGVVLREALLQAVRQHLGDVQKQYKSKVATIPVEHVNSPVAQAERREQSNLSMEANSLDDEDMW